jgi:hypothetical protein
MSFLHPDDLTQSDGCAERYPSFVEVIHRKKQLDLF